ncbi:hypothetical protein OG345_40995 (plasmid) [Streptomyces sp. NBC_01220]|uniref:hypothetical protein n=1 Tax=Streptomyces sp. NBC_01220 TaxID=2903781 RepID=UPI002F90B706|nr:hypothetical protein OG345_40995 [Streptomyces sp. NBC_01220]
MTTQTVDTFSALHTCFSADLAVLIGSQPPRYLSPAGFIDQVEEVRDLLADSRLPHHEDASDDLDHAADHLTEALTSTDDEQLAHLSQARTHLRDAIGTAS